MQNQNQNNLNLNIDSWLPIFTGFQYTIFECDCEAEYLEDGKTYDDYIWDYEDWRNRNGKAACTAIQCALLDLHGLDISIEFEGITNNFQDINCGYKMSENTYAAITKLLKTKAFAKWVKQTWHFNGYDGYAPNYSNVVLKAGKNIDGVIENPRTNFSKSLINDYIIPQKKLSHFFGLIIEYLLESEGYNKDKLYNDMVDSGEVNYINYKDSDNENEDENAICTYCNSTNTKVVINDSGVGHQLVEECECQDCGGTF